MKLCLSNCKILLVYLLLISSIPYLALLLFVADSAPLLFPYFVSSFMIIIGSRITIPSINKSTRKFAIKESKLYLVIVGIALVELSVSGNLPALGIFLGPTVSHDSYGIPLIHSLFNGMSLFYVVNVYARPSLSGIAPSSSQISRCILICIYILLTFQRLPFVLILLALLFSKVLESLLLVKRLLSVGFVTKRLAQPAALFFVMIGLSVLFVYVGSTRNDLSSFSFPGFGSFVYNSHMISFPPAIQVPIQYLFTPILNAYNNIDIINRSPWYLYHLASPYILTPILNLFQYSQPDQIYLANPVFNAISHTTLLFYIFPFGFLLFMFYSAAMGFFVSKKFLFTAFHESSHHCSAALNATNTNIALICISGFSLNFFLPWYSFPVVIIGILLSLLIRVVP